MPHECAHGRAHEGCARRWGTATGHGDGARAVRAATGHGYGTRAVRAATGHGYGTRAVRTASAHGRGYGCAMPWGAKGLRITRNGSEQTFCEHILDILVLVF